MPSKDKDAATDVGDRPREKRSRHKSEKSERGEKKEKSKGKDKHRDREKEKDQDKDRDRDRGSDVDRDKQSSLSSARHHKSSRSSKSKSTESEVHSHSHRRHKTKSTREREKLRDDLADQAAPSDVPDVLDPVTELTGTRVSSTDRISLPYPTFSKAHCREYVQSKEDVTLKTGHGTDPLTPDATDVGSGEKMRRTKSADSPVTRKTSSARREPRTTGTRPPTPPDTDISAAKDREGTPPAAAEGDAACNAPEPRLRLRASRVSAAAGRDGRSRSRVSRTPSQATFVRSPAARSPPAGARVDEESTITESTEKPSPPRSPATDGTARPDLLDQDQAFVRGVDLSPESAPDSSPKTPTQTAQFPPPPSSFQHEKFHYPRYGHPASGAPTPSQTPASDLGNPPPRPPPPPPINIQETPKVDYLTQNGGLAHAAPKNFLAVLPRQNGTRPSNPPLRGAETLFAPFFNLLDQYQSVLTSNRSVAVATGHRTVARRLLDRLENVFSRDLPLDGCSCIICEHSGELRRGLGWGEVLERVSGRLDLPQWPPFDLGSLASKATEDMTDLPARPASPVNLDPDIAEEFREHYIKQSKRVRVAVGKWMSNVADTPAPSPHDIDDETLAFAILTSLNQEDRPYFNALLLGSRELQPAMRAPTPLRKPRSEFVVKSGLALQRLYRLQQAPRDAETAVYLVNNPHMHDLLRTITDINPSEWEILTSGRFDGFLWSGATGGGGGGDDDVITPTAEAPSRGAVLANSFFPSSRPGTGLGAGRHSPAAVGGSRTTTPIGSSYSRGATPASFVSGMSTASSSYPSRHAVSNDEETEVAAVAEVEREIFAGMEALEDAFEMLHRKAETVRTALRQRGAGLQVSLQNRRASSLGGGAGIDVLPNSGGLSPGCERPSWGDEESMVSESDWGGDDFELAPDDSASNISSSRHRRPKRRNERRTPAPIEEEEE